MYQYPNQTGNGMYGNAPMQPLQNNYTSNQYQQNQPMQTQPMQGQPMQQQGYMQTGMQTGMQPQQQQPMMQQQNTYPQQGMQQQGMQSQNMQQQGMAQGMQQQGMPQQSTYPQQGMPQQGLQQQGLQQQGMSQQGIPQQGMQPQGVSQQFQPQGLQQQPIQTQSLQPQPSASLQPMVTGQSQQALQPLMPQQTGFYRQGGQPVLEPLKPTATGFVNSFANNGLNTNIKIPTMRLSFITAQDQAKFETLFRSIVTKGSNTVSGENCRAILMKSGLQPSQLAKIWQLSDTNRAGELLFPEFALAMHLINNVLQGDSIPYELDSKTKNEVASFINAINLSVVGEDDGFKTPFDDLFKPQQTLQPQGTGFMPTTSFGMPAQMTGGFGQPQATTFGQIPSQATGGFGQPQPTTFGLQPQGTGSFAQQSTGGMMQQPQQGLQPQGTGSFGATQQTTGGYIQPQGTGSFNNPGFVQPQNTGSFVPKQQQVPQPQPIMSQNTGGYGPPMPTTFGIQPQNTGGMVPQQMAGGMVPQQMTGGLTSQMTGGMPQTSFMQNNMTQQLQPQATGYLPPSNFNATMPLTVQKTGFGNNEIYTQANFGNQAFSNGGQELDTITSEEKSLFYKIFETFDTENKGFLVSATAVEIFRKSGLNRSDLEQIWNLCDINNSGQLNKQEFALGMHLVYGRLNGRPIPSRLPPHLVPSSTQILDNLKNQLKSSASDPNKKSFTRMDALSYRNDDNNDAIPNFRNRRKNYPNNDYEKERKEREEKQRAEEQKRKEDERRAKEEIERARSQNRNASSISEKSTAIPTNVNTSTQISVTGQDVQSVQQRIQSVQQQLATRNQSIPYDVKKRYNDVVAKLPTLFSEIYKIDSEIMQARIELCKQKNPPSIVGTGPNGEITEEDRRKAKSKALLRSRMNALTGKGADTEDLDNSEQFTKEVEKIKSESEHNKEIINDIRTSISELSAPLKSVVTGTTVKTTPSEFEKWEIGVGLESDVRDFIQKLKKDLLLAPTSSTNSSTQSQSVSQSSNKTPSEDRAAQLKEQAQKRMRERLAKFGISRKNREEQNENTSGQESRSSDKLNVKETPFEEVPSSHNSSNVSANISQGEDEQEDEEERKLKEQLEQLKLKKKSEKEKRLQELRDQIAAEEKENQPNDVSSGMSSTNQQSTNQQTPSPMQPLQQSQNNQTYNVQTQHSGHQSLSSHATGSSEAKQNTYFKPSLTPQSTFDREKAEQQRRIQRGLEDDDDGWSDEDEDNIYNDSARNTTTNNMAANGNSSASGVPIAPPIPSPTVDVPIAPPIASSSIQGAVPVAPPIPQPTNDAPQPIAPPVPTPSGPEDTVDIPPPVPAATPATNSHSMIPPVPVAPPLPTVTSNFAPPPPLPTISNQDEQNDHDIQGEQYDSDVLSIPESVDSDGGHNSGSVAPAGIPPPPPLPNF
ncbi:Actin cytoskeleton-regulatory complex protein PAN1 [Nakaseomyces bracarensis]|uniref:Actin cytoskeleton-regulatory complex protein PAN1 n=1 Tax=Nakaseomyces bracarensis TaxID=273131 RepID=A0ABR4NW61_9SACH